MVYFWIAVLCGLLKKSSPDFLWKYTSVFINTYVYFFISLQFALGLSVCLSVSLSLSCSTFVRLSVCVVVAASSSYRYLGERLICTRPLTNDKHESHNEGCTSFPEFCRSQKPLRGSRHWHCRRSRRHCQASSCQKKKKKKKSILTHMHSNVCLVLLTSLSFSLSLSSLSLSLFSLYIFI